MNINLYSQEVPQPVNNKGIYDFIDELANIHIITINSAVKPYSRLFISQRLKEAEEKKDELNPRQQKELEFYIRDFGKERGGKTGRRGDSEPPSLSFGGRRGARTTFAKASVVKGLNGSKVRQSDTICFITGILCSR